MGRTELTGATLALPPVATRWQAPEVAKTYDRDRFSSPAGRFFNYLSKRALRRTLQSIPGGPGVTLDLPCGTGRATEVVRQFTSHIVGADISVAMMIQAMERFGSSANVPLVASDVGCQPFRDNAFDCVTSIRFMMHLNETERKRALKEMARVATKYVIVEYGCTSSWLRFLRKLKRLLLAARARKTTFLRGVPWKGIISDLDHADLKLVQAYPTARGLSESIVLLLAKR